MHLLLWAAQGILAASLFWAAGLKLFQPIEKLAALWPWAGQVPVSLVKLTGLVDLLGAVGLLAPTLLRVKPKLTAIAAIGIVILMACASVFHSIRGETSVIGVNLFFALIAAFIAWGRLRKSPGSSEG
ncbi:DoxX family protein [Larkinella insperata]|uniref:DoxX family protein n=1 Tax=Larkinella insperata TaxID=332158 RepID=A0ABW3Q9R5_9BACT|nr:DoxX family protein [Larkinella insperata]